MLFKDKYFWRAVKSNESTEIHSVVAEIRSVWPELPATMTHIDAVHETNDLSKQLWFFIGREIYIFKGAKLSMKMSLADIGIPKKYSKIDAIFKWPNNNQTYIFSGEDYWKLDGDKVCAGYPESIEAVWHDSYNIDAAFSSGDTLFFLKDEFYHEFDPFCMQMDRMTRYKIGLAFLGCGSAPVMSQKARRSSDVVRLNPEKCEEDKNNIEKHNLKGSCFKLIEFGNRYFDYEELFGESEFEAEHDTPVL